MSEGRHSYVPFYASDWIAGTSRMTPMQELVYFRVCCYIWDKAEPCPASELPLMLGAIDGWPEIVAQLVAAGKLVETPDGSLTNKKALSVAETSKELWNKKSRGGKKGAKKTNSATPDSTPDATPAKSPASTPAKSPDGSGPGVPSHNHNHNLQEAAPLPPNGSDENPPPAAAKVDDDLVQKTHDAICDLSGADVVKSPSWMQSSLVRSWLTEGIASETIVEAVREVMGRGTAEPNGPIYFSGAVRERHAALLAESAKELAALAMFDGGRQQRIDRCRDTAAGRRPEHANWDDVPEDPAEAAVLMERLEAG